MVADSTYYGLKQHYAEFFSAECLKIRVKAFALNRSIFFLVFKSFMSYWARHKYKGMILTKKDAIAMTSIQVVILAAHVS